MRAHVVLALLTALTALTVVAPVAAQTKEECASAANTAQILRDGGKFREARAALSTCASAACPAVVTDACRPWLTQLEAEIPTVVFDVRDVDGRDLVDVRVLLDGTPLLDRLSGTAIPLDPGAHTLRFEADGLEPAEEQVLLRVKEKSRVLRVRLAPSARGAVPAPAATSRSSGSWRTLTGVGLGVLAVGAAGAGAYFVAQSNDASGAASDLRRQIGSSSGCFDIASAACGQLSEHVDAQHRDRDIAVTLFVTAGVLAVSAVAIWLLWPGADPPSPTRVGELRF